MGQPDTVNQSPNHDRRLNLKFDDVEKLLTGRTYINTLSVEHTACK